MLYISGSKHMFMTGEILDANDLTDEFDTANNYLADVRSQRVVRTAATYTLPGISSFLDAEFRRIRFTAPVACELEKVWVGAHYTSTSEVDGYLMTSSLAPIPDLSNPYFKLVSSSDGYSVSINDVVPQQPVRMTANQEYVLEIQPTGAGSFTFNRLDLTLIFKTDLFNFTDINILDRLSYQFMEQEPPDATKIGTLKSAVTSAMTSIQNFTTVGAYRAMVFQVEGLTSVSSASLGTFSIPMQKNTTNLILNMYLWGSFTSNGSAILTATLKDSSGSTAVTVSGSGSTSSSNHLIRGTSSLSTSLTGGSNGPGDPSQDYSIVFSVGAGTLKHGFLLVWLV